MAEHLQWNLDRFSKGTQKSRFSFSKRKQRFFLFLYDFHICEYESIFIFFHNQSSHLCSICSETFLERISFYRKIELEVLTKDFKAILWVFKDPFLHYVKNPFIGSDKNSTIWYNWYAYCVSSSIFRLRIKKRKSFPLACTNNIQLTSIIRH